MGSSRLGSESSVRSNLDSAPMDKAGVIAKYGEPNLVFHKDGREIFEYKRISISERPTSYIPIVALFYNGHDYNLRNLYVYFDKNGNMLKYDTVYESGKYEKKD
ncbi:MAG: hypothetical protein LBL52_01420 [Rickettsiales bacterium]|nr:hypothetical protein [Rickettsiales bacterium]